MHQKFFTGIRSLISKNDMSKFLNRDRTNQNASTSGRRMSLENGITGTPTKNDCCLKAGSQQNPGSSFDLIQYYPSKDLQGQQNQQAILLIDKKK
ncbi:hypothetical protein QL285_049486 [Trifolium repens]|jgi:hypothetical protein|nr:hypothetical protein QL285_049486 [Trifolium repens]